MATILKGTQQTNPSKYGVTATLITCKDSLEGRITIDKDNDIIYISSDDVTSGESNDISFAISYSQTEKDVTFPVYIDEMTDNEQSDSSNYFTIQRFNGQYLTKIGDRFAYTEYGSGGDIVLAKPYCTSTYTTGNSSYNAKPTKPIWVEYPFGWPETYDETIKSIYLPKARPRTTYDLTWPKNIVKRSPSLFLYNNGWTLVTDPTTLKALHKAKTAYYGKTIPSGTTGEFLIMMPPESTEEYRVYYTEYSKNGTTYSNTWIATTDTSEISKYSITAVDYCWLGSGTDLFTDIELENTTVDDGTVAKVLIMPKLDNSFVIGKTKEDTITLPYEYGLSSDLVDFDDEEVNEEYNLTPWRNYGLVGAYNHYYTENDSSTAIDSYSKDTYYLWHLPDYESISYGLQQGYLHNFSYVNQSDKYLYHYVDGSSGQCVKLKLSSWFILHHCGGLFNLKGSLLEGGESIHLHIGDSTFTFKRKGSSLTSNITDTSLNKVMTLDNYYIPYIGANGGYIQGESKFYCDENDSTKSDLLNNLKISLVGTDRWSTGSVSYDENYLQIDTIEYDSTNGCYIINWKYRILNFNDTICAYGIPISNLDTTSYTRLTGYTYDLSNWYPSVTVNGVLGDVFAYAAVIKVVYDSYSSITEGILLVRDSNITESLSNLVSYDWGDVLSTFAAGGTYYPKIITLNSRHSQIWNNIDDISDASDTNVYAESVNVYLSTADVTPSWAHLSSDITTGIKTCYYRISEEAYYRRYKYKTLTLDPNLTTSDRKFRIVVKFSNGLVFTKHCIQDALDYVNVKITSTESFSIGADDGSNTSRWASNVNSVNVCVKNNYPANEEYLVPANVYYTDNIYHTKCNIYTSVANLKFVITCTPLNDIIDNLNCKYCNVEGSSTDDEYDSKVTAFTFTETSFQIGYGQMYLKYLGDHRYLQWLNIMPRY